MQKMKNIFLIIINILFINNSFGQSGIKVEYSVSFIKDEITDKNTRIKTLFEESNIGAKLSHFILNANKDQANFFAEKYNGLDKQKWEYAMIMADYESILFVDRVFSKIYYNNPDDEFKKDKYLIQKNILKEWVINHKDTITINGFKCYKATAKEGVVNSNGVKIQNEIVAWFTPEIPFQFGPNGYGDLPGLILQLTTNRVNFYAKTINFKENLEIIALSKGIEISEDEFIRISYEASKKNKNIKD